MSRISRLAFAAAFLLCSPGIGAQDIDSLLANMTVRQKVAQLMVPAIDTVSHTGDDVYRKWAEDGIGGLIVMEDSLEHCMRRLNDLQSRAAIPMIITIDGEWGASMRFRECPLFPRQMQLGALKDETLVYEMGCAVGREMKALHIGINFAPVADINVEPSNPVINTRSFGEDREKVARYAWAYAKGMQDQGVSACAKHFPGHGDTKTDSHKGLPVLPYGRERLDSLELYPFRYAIAQGVDLVMSGHLSVPALDTCGMPASLSPAITSGLLRNELGYRGIIVTDALDMAGAREICDNDGPKTALAAYKAGADMLLMPTDIDGTIDLFCKAVASGEISEADLNARCRRILELKKRRNMFSEEFRAGVDLGGLEQVAENPGSRELISEISRKSLVLVHRRWRSLPIRPRSWAVRRGKVAYLALGASGTTMADSLKAFAPRIDTFSLERDFTLEQLEEMRGRLSRYSKVIICFHQTDNRPAKDFGIRPEIYDYIGLWARRQKLVGVYFGNPYALDRMPWYRKCRSFVIAWNDNPYNCAAAARAVCGLIPFEGTLPVSAGSR